MWIQRTGWGARALKNYGAPLATKFTYKWGREESGLGIGDPPCTNKLLKKWLTATANQHAQIVRSPICTHPYTEKTGDAITVGHKSITLLVKRWCEVRLYTVWHGLAPSKGTVLGRYCTWRAPWCRRCTRSRHVSPFSRPCSRCYWPRYLAISNIFFSVADSGPFWPLGPGSGMGLFRIPDPKSIFLKP